MRGVETEPLGKHFGGVLAEQWRRLNGGRDAIEVVRVIRWFASPAGIVWCFASLAAANRAIPLPAAPSMSVYAANTPNLIVDFRKCVGERERQAEPATGPGLENYLYAGRAPRPQRPRLPARSVVKRPS
jgi:hypothetical protein